MEVTLNISSWRENFSHLTLNEMAFLSYYKSRLEELGATHILFDAKEVSGYLGMSESWARSTYKRLLKKGELKKFKQYFEILNLKMI